MRCEDLARADERLLPVGGAVELEPNAVDDVALGPREPRLETLRRVGRVLPLRQRHDADVEALRDRELHAAQRGVLAGGVGVEAEEQPPGEPLQLLQLPLA